MDTGEKIDGLEVLLHKVKNQDFNAIVEDLKLMCKLQAKTRALANTTTDNDDQLSDVLIEIFFAAGDELSAYQDKVVQDAYLGTERQRITIQRHKRTRKPANKLASALEKQPVNGEDKNSANGDRHGGKQKKPLPEF